MAGPIIDILMYHSISEADGATSISPAIFEKQIDAIATAGIPVVSLDDLVAAKNNDKALPPRSAIITFDDGFLDFSTHAWPVLQYHGFLPVVYLPTGHIGLQENWVGANNPARSLMDWELIHHLAAQGVVFASHTVSHPDLNSLSQVDLDDQLDQSKMELERQLNMPVDHFAPPYGYANIAVQSDISRRYRTSVGTRFDQADINSPIHDLPRLEMYYFTDILRWKDHLAGRGSGYLKKRQVFRKLGKIIRKFAF